MGKHAPFVWASYIAVIAGIVGLAVWLWLDGRRQQAELKRLEAAGVRRRSAEPKPGEPEPNQRT